MYMLTGNAFEAVRTSTMGDAPSHAGLAALPAGTRFLVTIEGARGKFWGQDRQKDKITGLGFHLEVRSPHDPATGQVAGKRQYKPIVFTKEWGPASPQIFQALVRNEALKSVLFEFLRPGPEGRDEVFHKVILKNARVVGLEQYVRFNAAGHQNADDPRSLEDVSLAFGEIEIENKIRKTVAMDRWSSSV